ncbi:MAG: ShlB/FhaC/HecB family hemolysin secretion/activation protein [Leptospirales bacterium]
MKQALIGFMAGIGILMAGEVGISPSFATQTKNVEHHTIHVSFSGNTVVPSSVLQKVVAPFVKIAPFVKSRLDTHRLDRLTLNSLVCIKNSVTQYYRNHGYVTSFATLPSKIVDGLVVVDIHEGKLWKVTVKNKSRLSPYVAKSLVSSDSTGTVFNVNSLDSDMALLASVAPGSNSFLTAGEKPMTSDLSINIPQQPLVTGNVSINDYGMAYTGALTLQNTTTLNNLAHHGDSLSLNVSSSIGYNAVQASYSMLLGSFGGRAGIGYSADNYTVGNGYDLFSYQAAPSVFAALGLSGYGQVFSAFFDQPIVHTSKSSLDETISYSHTIQSDTYVASAGVADDRNIDAVSIATSFQETDTNLGGGTTVGNVSLNGYNLGTFGAGTSLLNPYGLSAPGTHGFIKWNLARTNRLAGLGNSLYLSTSGLFAGGDGNLDPLEEFSLGGEGNLRGFATATLFGYNAIDGNIEFRHVFTSFPAKYGQLMATAFFDAGGIQLEPAATFSSSGSSGSTAAPFVTLYSPGIGLKYDYKMLAANLEGGTPIGNLPSEIPNQPFGQLWFSVGLHY